MPSTNSDPPSHLLHLPPPKTPRQSPPRQARPQDGISAGPLRRRLTSPVIPTVGTSPEMAIATQPPNLDAAKDREKWRRVTPPESKRQSPEQSRIMEETKTLSLPAQDEHHQSSEGMPHPPNESDKGTLGERASEVQVASSLSQPSPSRRGIWDWARAGTGRLNIMGRIPHPEWRGPPTVRNFSTASNGLANGGTIYESHDDFSIPSTTATEPDNVEQQAESASAKLEGIGLANGTFMSPSFAQTKRSSDELVAAASSAGSPESRLHEVEQWTNGEVSTPSAASKDSPPSTPDTPTPQQRRTVPTAGAVEKQGPHTPTPRRDSHAEAENEPSQDTPERKAGTDSDATPVKKKVSKNGPSSPSSKSSANTTKASKSSPSPHHIPTYKIALAPNLFSLARTGATST
jgi:hypothetical protein